MLGQNVVVFRGGIILAFCPKLKKVNLDWRRHDQELSVNMSEAFFKIETTRAQRFLPEICVKKKYVSNLESVKCNQLM